MIAIKALYDNGKITWIDPLPEQIKKAKLTIVFEPENDDEKISIPAKEFVALESESESEYKLVGLHSFFDTEDDKNVNWEEYFGHK